MGEGRTDQFDGDRGGVREEDAAAEIGTVCFGRKDEAVCHESKSIEFVQPCS